MSYLGVCDPWCDSLDFEELRHGYDPGCQHQHRNPCTESRCQQWQGNQTHENVSVSTDVHRHSFMKAVFPSSERWRAVPSVHSVGLNSLGPFVADACKISPGSVNLQEAENLPRSSWTVRDAPRHVWESAMLTVIIGTRTTYADKCYTHHPIVPKSCSLMTMTPHSTNVKLARFISCVFELF